MLFARTDFTRLHPRTTRRAPGAADLSVNGFPPTGTSIPANNSQRSKRRQPHTLPIRRCGRGSAGQNLAQAQRQPGNLQRPRQLLSARPQHKQRMDLSLPGRLSIRGKHQDLRLLPAGMGLAAGPGQRCASLLDARQRHPLPGWRRVRGLPRQIAGRALLCITSTPQLPTTSWRPGPSAASPLSSRTHRRPAGAPSTIPTARSFRRDRRTSRPTAAQGTLPSRIFSQASIFDNPPGQYAVRKEAPQFNDVLTKVWGRHTVKMGAFTQNTDNYQSTFSTYQDGNLTIKSGTNPDLITGNPLGSPQNPTANFVMGVLTGYSENNSSPIADIHRLSGNCILHLG